MDTILQEKKKGEKNFRVKIDQFLSKSPYTKNTQQLSPSIMQQLLSSPYLQGICINGKVNIEKLCEKIGQSEGATYAKELQKIIGKKQMKIAELHQLLKNFELTSFNIEEEMVKYFFEGENLSLQKIDSVMHGLGMPSLNSKDKEILIQCFDYDRNKAVTKSDLAEMAKRCAHARQKQRKVSQIMPKTLLKDATQA